MRIVDTKGQLCPAPLIATRKALKETLKGESFTVLTDNQTSFNNLSRFLKDNNTGFQVSETDGVWTLIITKTSGETVQTKAGDYCSPSVNHFEKGNFIVVITSDKMGEGDDELGHLLMSNFIKALKDLDKLPGYIVFYNKGVTLASKSSPVIEHLKDLGKMGVEILLCATCVTHYKLEANIGTGTLSNMYSIAEVMASTGNIIKP
ncbi:MAG: sulfurtransferase-like selenium metabolism protein YedF [Bacteroidetes bacterium]|nr:MAG: sulfurtransferase-like selenium metabolism protein YedF [Bacteroidota bacterium]